MDIKYTKHAEKKFSDLRKFGIIISKSKVRKTINKPKYISLDNSNSISAATYNSKHNIRVVYRQQKDGIIIITFYIYRKGRYGET